MANTTDLSNLDNQVSQIYGTGAVNIPLGTNAQRPKNPTTGMLRWNTSQVSLEYYTDVAWVQQPTPAQMDAKYVQKATPVFTGDLDAGGKRLTNVSSTPQDKDAVNLVYLTQRFASGVGINAETLGGNPSSYYATQIDLTNISNRVTTVDGEITAHLADFNNPHHVTKDQIGLGNVANVSPTDAPVSNATQAALANKYDKRGLAAPTPDRMAGDVDFNGFNALNILNFVGMVCNFAAPTAPTGFLACNGGAFSRSTYARLFAKIGTTYGAGDGSTTFNVPDLRGYFVRGADIGNAIPVGAVQSDSIGSHTHSVNDPGHGHVGTTDSQGAHQHNVNVKYWGSGISSNGGYVQTGVGTGGITDVQGAHTHNVTITNRATGITIAAAGSGETRPKNVAMLPCIMY